MLKSILKIKNVLLLCIGILLISSIQPLSFGDKIDLSDKLYKDGYYYGMIKNNTCVEIFGTNLKTKNLTIPDRINGYPVVRISPFAFQNKEIETLVLPKRLEEIGESAFQWCGIKKVVFPDTLKKIGFAAFYENKIENVSLPKHLKTLDGLAFYSNSIKSIKWPEGLSRISEGAFHYNLLTEVVLPDSIREVSESAFCHNKIESVTFNDKLVKIGDGAFRENAIYHMSLPSKLEVIGSKAFLSNNMNTVVLPSSLKQMCINAFDFDKIHQVAIGSNDGLNIYDNKSYFDTNQKAIIGFLNAYNLAGLKAGTYAHNTLTNNWTYDRSQPKIDKTRSIKGMTVVDFKVGDAYMWVNGIRQKNDVWDASEPFVVDGCLYLPMTALTKGLRGYVEHNINEFYALYMINRTHLLIDFEKERLGGRAEENRFQGNVYIKNNRVFMRSDFLEEEWGLSIDWNKNSNNIRIIIK